MTGQDIVNAVRAEVIEPNPAFFTTPTLITWINNGQKNFVRKTRCLQNSAMISTVVGQTSYPLPSDWLGTEKVFFNYPVNGVPSWVPLNPYGIEKIAQEFPNFLSTDPSMLGKPSIYYIFAGTLNIFPAPQVAGTNCLFLFYESKPTVITSLSDPLSIDETLSDGLEAYVLWKLWKMDQEDQLASEQLQRYQDEIGEGRKWKKKRLLDGKWKVDIESFLPFNYSSVNNSAFNNQLNPLNL
jgi:hypothetical protein